MLIFVTDVLQGSDIGVVGSNLIYLLVFFSNSYPFWIKKFVATFSVFGVTRLGISMVSTEEKSTAICFETSESRENDGKDHKY